MIDLETSGLTADNNTVFDTSRVENSSDYRHRIDVLLPGSLGRLRGRLDRKKNFLDRGSAQFRSPFLESFRQKFKLSQRAEGSGRRNTLIREIKRLFVLALEQVVLPRT